MRLPSGVYHENYAQDHAWWQTRFVWIRMVIVGLILFVAIPYYAISTSQLYYLALANTVGYTILGAMGVQLLIGYTGQVTLGHAAFIAVGGYTSSIAMLQWGIPYPITIVLAAIVAGIWSVLFGLPSARVKGFYLIMTTMAAQFVTVDFIITQYVAQIGGRGHYFSLPPGTITVGPIVFGDRENDIKVYYLMLVLVIGCTFFLANLLRTRIGRAWIAIRDNDIAAEVLGVNIVRYKLLAFFVAGMLGGITGAFWVSNLSAISPEHFQFGLSLWLVGVILIGGTGSMYGTIFGALFMTLIPEALKSIILTLTPYHPIFTQLLDKFLYVREATFGLVIILFLLYEPKGLAYRWGQIKNYIHLFPFSY
jgi:branched-chain amino acid transport system permease protein